MHHAPDGGPYANPSEMAARVVDAAAQTGIGHRHDDVARALSINTEVSANVSLQRVRRVLSTRRKACSMRSLHCARRILKTAT
ncbi:MAG: hypothetical protein CBARDCOR_5142 [uncultured Caballeronia sp.]|nr:MAG: hypothetical protein CBARDCOR_5142 [uncultured Caballeronia sp.]